jgi:hypothetical protein
MAEMTSLFNVTMAGYEQPVIKHYTDLEILQTVCRHYTVTFPMWSFIIILTSGLLIHFSEYNFDIHAWVEHNEVWKAWGFMVLGLAFANSVFFAAMMLKG